MKISRERIEHIRNSRDRIVVEGLFFAMPANRDLLTAIDERDELLAQFVFFLTYTPQLIETKRHILDLAAEFLRNTKWEGKS